MTKTKSLVLWSYEDLLGSSVESLLKNLTNWNPISISKEEGFEALSKAVETTHAELVILRQGEPNDSTILLMHLLQAHPGLRVITINFENNVMEIYNKQEILIKEAADLNSVIENNP